MKLLTIAVLLAATALCQKPAPKDEALEATRHEFMLVSTRAVALFQSADTIDARLRADGSSLHPGTATLRLRIERTLNEAESAIDKREIERANKNIKVAGELVTRFAKKIGAE